MPEKLVLGLGPRAVGYGPEKRAEFPGLGRGPWAVGRGPVPLKSIPIVESRVSCVVGLRCELACLSSPVT
jgi:hypothetical protein